MPTVRNLTPEEVAAYRLAHFHSLTMALLDGNMPRWNSATDEEREEVRDMIGRAGVKMPNEKRLILLDRQRRTQEIQRLEVEAKNERKRQVKEAKAAAPKASK